MKQTTHELLWNLDCSKLLASIPGLVGKIGNLTLILTIGFLWRILTIAFRDWNRISK